MAAESYRSPEHNHAFPDLETANSFSSHHAQMHHSSSSDSGSFSSSRADSITTPMPPGTYAAKAPLHEAVNTAFDKSDAASQVDPNLVAQITEQVINNLKASGITGATSNYSQQSAPAHSHPPLHHPAPTQAHHPVPRSPTSTASSSVPHRYTPPSPNRHDISSLGSSSPEPQFSDTASHSSRGTNRPGRRISNPSVSGEEDMTSSRTRQRPVRVPSAVEETTLEKIWQPLFMDGRPTARLGQFLRGLAKHLIEDCEPRNSILVTPGKMASFFETTKLPEELYPWSAIFGGRLTNAAISRLYRDLRCQHHLAQFNYHDVPTIPGLTPFGFESFMTTLILAHPDHEYERLAKAVLEMPISNAEDSRERFPKELSRRLFPRTEDLMQLQRFVAAVSADPAIQLRNSHPMPPPPSTQPPPMPQASSFAERERNPYSSSSLSSSAIDDDDLRGTSIPIERERKPYTAREGTGKMYEDSRGNIANGLKQESTSRPVRANSAIPVQPPFAQPRDIPASTAPRHHRMSMGAGGSRYSGSAPVPNPYTRSEGTNIGDVPPSFYASNIHNDTINDHHKYGRRPEEDIPKGYGASPRNMAYDHQPNGYDSRRPQGGTGGTDGYGSHPGYGPPPQQMPRY